MSNCTVYIDEAGDLGYQRGTQWFILSAVVVDKTEERAIRTTMAQIKSRLMMIYQTRTRRGMKRISPRTA